MTFFHRHQVLVSVSAGILISLPFMMKRRGKSIKNGLFTTLALCIFLSAVSVISVLLFAALENFISGKPVAVGAVSTYGVYLFSPFFFFILLRKKYRAEVFDDYAFYIIPSMIIQRIRCLYDGCCYGIAIPGTTIRFPTREAEIIFYCIMWFFLKKKEKKNKKGSLFPLMMICYGSFRFIEEFFRFTENQSVLHLAHLWSVICIIIGLSVYGEFRQHHEYSE